jgi:hypothetical protein
MKLDPLKQFVKLRQQLLEEKGSIEERLEEINEALGHEEATITEPSIDSAQDPKPKATRGRKPRAGNGMSLREALFKTLAIRPLARSEVVKAVEGMGFRFTTKDPLNSISSILYAKNTPIKRNPEGKYYIDGGAQTGGKEKGDSGNGQSSTGRKKRKMSPEGKARIAAAQRARWAKQKSAKR